MNSLLFQPSRIASRPLTRVITLAISLCMLSPAAIGSSPLLVYGFDETPGLFDPDVRDARVGAGQLSGGPGIASMPSSNSSLAVKGNSLYLSNLPFYSLDEQGAVDLGRWFEFTMDILEGYETTVTSIGFHVLRRATDQSGAPEGNGAPQAYSVFSSVNGFAVSLGSGVVPLAQDDSFTHIEVGFEGMPWFSGVSGSIEFRIVFWSPEGTGGGPGDRVWRLDELMVEGYVQDFVEPPDCEESFYVAPHGHDNNPGTASLPFASLERARDAVRALDCRFIEDFIIHVEPGDYFLTEPFVLGVEDSGRDGHRIVYRGTGVPGSARLLGGATVEGWESVDGRIFRAPVESGAVFNTLYENGVRAEKARFPSRIPDARFSASDAPYLRSERGTHATLTWKDGDLDAIAAVDLEGATLVVWPWGYQDWGKFPRRIETFNHSARTIEVEEMAMPIQAEARYYLQGRREFLNTPGEFHLDRENGYLYYWPRFGHPAEQEIIAPRMRRIVVFDGMSAVLPIRDVVMEGLKLAYTDAFEFVEGPVAFSWSESSSGPDGAIHLRYAERIEIRNNHVLGAGLNGIYLERSNKDNQIHGNLIQEVGVSGIVLAYHRQASQFPLDSNDRNRIENNRIRGLGAIAVDSAGINIWGGRDNVVRFCEISDGARYAVSLRGPFSQWAPGTDPADTLNDTNRPLADNNRIEFSHFYRVVQDSGDAAAVQMAGISSLSVFPVNFLEHLLIEDVNAHPSMFDVPPNGIFFDYTEGVTRQVVRNVEVRGTPNAYRANRTDFGHTFENVSWRSGFDSQMMYYPDIGLRADFPDEYRVPPEVTDVRVTEVTNGDQRKLLVSWKTEPNSPPVAVSISAEGVVGYERVDVLPGEFTALVDKPQGSGMVKFRLRARGPAGAISQGTLVIAAEPPEAVVQVEARGVPGGVKLSWNAVASGHGYRLVFLNSNREAIEFPAGKENLELLGLNDHQVYDLRLDVLDADNHYWEGSVIQVTAGARQSPPEDYVAWWAFDEIDLSGEIKDSSGSGLSLEAVDRGIGYADGVFGRAITFNGEGAYLIRENPEELHIGHGDYALSFWIRKTPSTSMAGRVLNFGGGSRGVFEHWRLDQPNPMSGLEIFANDYTIGAVLHDGNRAYSTAANGVHLAGHWVHVVVNIERSDAMSLWINGEWRGQVSITQSIDRDISSDLPLVLGKSARLEHENLYWSGRMDQLRIYKRALSSSEIADLFNESPRGPFLPGVVKPIEGAWILDPRFGKLYGSEEGWVFSPYMGWLELGAFPWIYHPKLGWLSYLIGHVGKQVWLFHPQINWMVIPETPDGSFLFHDGGWKTGSFW